MVIATQNPIEMEGVFQLPEAQRDRFQFKLIASLPDRNEEHDLLKKFNVDPTLSPDAIEQVVTADDLLAARNTVADIYIDDRVIEYILDIVGATRTHPDVEYGGSPRAALAFLNAAKARAAIHGREYAIPADAKAFAEPILVHRLVLNTDASLSDVSADEVIADIIDSIEPPGSTAPEEHQAE
jgi:MoxR-like ATPase